MTTSSMIARRDHVAPPIAKRLRLYFERAAGGGPSESAAARPRGGTAARRHGGMAAWRHGGMAAWRHGGMAASRPHRKRPAPSGAAHGNGSVAPRSIRFDDAPAGAPPKPGQITYSHPFFT
ncbi:hypothetical protein [Burkholderia pseudomallei]|uniref:hypothetical protein n=1 Tax=Burkholderia pseudomallei TaxID=28450 RepID=UPI0021F6DA77|nr:hypothetical protein [Burkholderia pseudomallei]MCW0009719.1 hypothetical protein [Burkholderia pseudomallei]MCW0061544.1 hypothetical protein [Burkholderia pseudomallei]